MTQRFKRAWFEAAIFVPQDPHVAACEMALVWKSKRTEAYYGFRAYQKENPQVANVLVRVLRKGKARGMPKWSCQSAMEHARWFEDLGVDNKEFTLPNEFGPYYNRMIQMEYADLYGFMDTAKAAADHELGWIAFKAQKDHQLKLQAA